MTTNRTPERPTILILSTSHEEHSRSRAAARQAYRALESGGARPEWLDLRELPLGVFPGAEVDPSRDSAIRRFNEADGWVIATPIHNWSAAAATINFLNFALDSDGRRYRPFVLIAGAGSDRSHLALDALSRSLVSEIQAVQVGAPIVAAGEAVDKKSGDLDAALGRRIDTAISALIAIAAASTSWAARAQGGDGGER